MIKIEQAVFQVDDPARAIHLIRIEKKVADELSAILNCAVNGA